MNKIIKTFLSLFILIVLSAIAVQAFALDSSLTGYDGTPIDTNGIGSGDGQAIQFLLSSDDNISAIQFRGSQGSTWSGGNMTVSIYEGGSTPMSGTLIDSKQIDTTNLDDYSVSPGWQTIELDDYTGVLEGGSTLYWLVIWVDSGSGNEVAWSADTSPGYSNGSMWYNVSGSWVEYTAYDLNFQILGVNGVVGGGSELEDSSIIYQNYKGYVLAGFDVFTFSVIYVISSAFWVLCAFAFVWIYRQITRF